VQRTRSYLFGFYGEGQEEITSFMTAPSSKKARGLLYRLVNTHLRCTGGFDDGVRISIVPHGDMTEMVIKPTSLLSGLWAQLADAILSGGQFRRCEAPGCNVGFHIRPGHNQRTTRVYCSQRCNLKAWRTIGAASRGKKRKRLVRAEGSDA
jgi:hypothetical protein